MNDATLVILELCCYQLLKHLVTGQRPKGIALGSKWQKTSWRDWKILFIIKVRQIYWAEKNYFGV